LEGTSDGKEIKLKKDYDGKNQTIDLSVAFKSFTVTSNLMDGNLYFGDNRIAKLKDGSHSVENYPVTDGSKAYIKKVFNDGEITSHKQKLISIADNQTIKLDVDGL
ncbi:TcaA 3rd/4th domain-containing protein, partial [Listeria monocytogenes]